MTLIEKLSGLIEGSKDQAATDLLDSEIKEVFMDWLVKDRCCLVEAKAVCWLMTAVMTSYIGKRCEEDFNEDRLEAIRASVQDILASMIVDHGGLACSTFRDEEIRTALKKDTSEMIH